MITIIIMNIIIFIIFETFILINIYYIFLFIGLDEVLTITIITHDEKLSHFKQLLSILFIS